MQCDLVLNVKITGFYEIYFLPDQPITMEGYLDLFDASAEQIYRHTVDSPDGRHSHPLVFGWYA